MNCAVVLSSNDAKCLDITLCYCYHLNSHYQCYEAQWWIFWRTSGGEV